MAIIEISALDTLLTSASLYSISTCDIDSDDLTTTIISTASTATADSPKIVIAQDTIAYVESLSDEELANFDSLLEEKGIEFESLSNKEAQEKPKTYKR